MPRSIAWLLFAAGGLLGNLGTLAFERWSSGTVASLLDPCEVTARAIDFDEVDVREHWPRLGLEFLELDDGASRLTLERGGRVTWEVHPRSHPPPHDEHLGSKPGRFEGQLPIQEFALLCRLVEDLDFEELYPHYTCLVTCQDTIAIEVVHRGVRHRVEDYGYQAPARFHALHAVLRDLVRRYRPYWGELPADEAGP